MLMNLIHKIRFLQSLKKRRWQYAMLGVFLSFIGPLGEWIFIDVLSEYYKDSFFLTLGHLE